MALSYHTCCSQLAALPSLNVAFPNTTAYNSTQAAFWSLQEASLAPSCIVQPASTEDVVQTINSLVSSYGRCRFAIKGQGHAPAAGFANIEDGVTIDMAALNDISLNDDQSVAHVGAGASWLDVYAFLDPYGKSVAGGRNGQVGVGGLTLGGGISYFSPLVGWTCDSVVNFEVVLASGRVVQANDKENRDLFRALKGGGTNFGVVTRFAFKTVEIGRILAGQVGNDIEYRGDVFEAFTGIADAAEYDVHASIVMGLGFSSSSKKWTLSSTPIYTKPVQHPPVYHDLFAIPNITDSMHLTKLSPFANESAIPQLNFLFDTTTFAPSTKLLNRIFDISNATLHDFEVADDSLAWGFAFEPLPTILVSHGAGKNVLGTSPKDGNGVVLLLSVYWISETISSRVQKKAQQLVSRINAAACDMGLGHSFVYANYANAGQKPFSSYGASNQKFLQQTAQKYDPKAVFQKLVPGGFKLDS